MQATMLSNLPDLFLGPDIVRECMEPDLAVSTETSTTAIQAAGTQHGAALHAMQVGLRSLLVSNPPIRQLVNPPTCMWFELSPASEDGTTCATGSTLRTRYASIGVQPLLAMLGRRGRQPQGFWLEVVAHNLWATGEFDHVACAKSL